MALVLPSGVIMLVCAPWPPKCIPGTRLEGVRCVPPYGSLYVQVRSQFTTYMFSVRSLRVLVSLTCGWVFPHPEHLLLASLSSRDDFLDPLDFSSHEQLSLAFAFPTYRGKNALLQFCSKVHSDFGFVLVRTF